MKRAVEIAQAEALRAVGDVFKIEFKEPHKTLCTTDTLWKTAARQSSSLRASEEGKE